ncbi:MAG: Rab family GTPase [Candidatus Hermodarchaeota archaeon]
MQSNQVKEDYIFKVVIVGPSKVGKTCLIHRYTEGYFLGEEVGTTIGVDFALKRVNVNLTDEKDFVSSICLQLWDFAGELHYKLVLPYYTKGTHIILLSFDASNIKTFKMLPRWLETLREHISDVPVILVSMKNDLGKTVPNKTIEEFMKKENINQIFHTSSKTGENVEKVFQSCIDYAIELIKS